MKRLIRIQNGFSFRKLFKGKRIWSVRVGVLSVFLFFLTSCGIYSFTGASIPPGAKTISVGYFTNKASLVEPTLSQTFTNTLRDMFTNQTNLEMVPRNGDLRITGEITGYTITPQAIQANQTAALNRLTVTVQVQYVNTLDHSKDFEASFSQFKDYSSSDNFNTVKDGLLKEISNNLADNIFNRALVNW
ncbi:MAG: LptE family protein [Bacteroidales bacterium]|nr:LptE family protein [Bacteroidales bacterium]